VSGKVLAVDLGGTRYRAGLAATGDPAAVQTLGEWPAPQDRATFLALLRDQVASSGATHLGIGVPGLARGSVCTWIPNLPHLDGLDLSAEFPKLHVALGNDAQFALVAEVAGGAARGLRDVLLLAIGTGIGSAVLAGGQVVAGNAGGACSFGWAAADVDDPGDDRLGWLERQASGRALDGVATRLGFADGMALIAAARTGREDAIAALEPPMRALGTALAGAVALLDPQTIILAGGVATSIDVAGPMILAALRRHVPGHLRGIDIRAGRFGTRAGLVGAAFAGARGADWRRQNG